MITTDDITRRQAKLLVRLLRQWTCAEIMARCAPIGWPDYGDYHFRKIEIENQIRKLLYDSDNLFDLGTQWGLLSQNRKPKHKRVKRKQKRERTIHD
jgi:hypothetical protein